MKNYILIGFMGAGKTTVGKLLAKEKGMDFVDTDERIVSEQNRDIPDIFTEDGDAHFRDLETELLKELSEREYSRIYSLGGGTPLRPRNREIARGLGTVVYLRVQPETVYARLKGDTVRPLLQCENPLQRIRELLAGRQEAYEAAAHVILDVDGLSFDEIMDRIEDCAVRGLKEDGK